MRKTSSREIVGALLGAAILGLLVVGVRSQSDVVVSERLPPVCGGSQSSTPFANYNPVDGKWHCAFQSPNPGYHALGGGLASGTLGTDVAGLTDTSNVTSGTVESTLYTLNTITLPANSFNVTGRGLVVDAFGTLAANANAKTYQVTFGSTVVATITGNTGNAADYKVSLQCIRTGASTQFCAGSIAIGTGNAATFATAAPAQTDTSAIVVAVKCENTAAAAACGSGKGLLAHFIN